MDAKNRIIAADFDRLAGASPSKPRWDHNNHYYPLMIQSIPPQLPRSAHALDVGCGTGQLCRLLAERFDHVTGVDLSEGQLNIARSFPSPRCEYVLGDFLDMPLERNSFACIVSAAAAHHMPFGEFLHKCREALMPGGALIVLDLYQPRTVTDYAWLGLAFLPNRVMEWVHNRNNPLSETEKQLWREHSRHDKYMSMGQIRKSAKRHLGSGFRLRRLLFFRYPLTYIKSDE